MKRYSILAWIFAGALLSGGMQEHTLEGASFDCAQAERLDEKTICDAPDLQWFDRQMARLYKLAKDHSNGAGRDALIADQRAFLGGRGTCNGEYECIYEMYVERLEALGARLDDLAGRFQSFAHFSGDQTAHGDLFVVRDAESGALLIETVGGNDHTCSFATDEASVTGRGVVKADGEADYEGKMCHIDVIPNGDDMDVETRNCSSYCGARATMDGHFVLNDAGSGAR